MSVTIRPATPQDTDTVSAILQEAALWLEKKNVPLWQAGELHPANLSADVSDRLFFIAESSSQPAGVVKFQLEDPLFWPEIPLGQSTFIHRLAIKRQFAGTGVSSAL